MSRHEPREIPTSESRRDVRRVVETDDIVSMPRETFGTTTSTAATEDVNRRRLLRFLKHRHVNEIRQDPVMVETHGGFCAPWSAFIYAGELTSTQDRLSILSARSSLSTATTLISARSTASSAARTVLS